jgi:hypothetical protein
MSVRLALIGCPPLVSLVDSICRGWQRCVEVIPGLFLGDWSVATDAYALQTLSISHVLNCSPGDVSIMRTSGTCRGSYVVKGLADSDFHGCKVEPPEAVYKSLGVDFEVLKGLVDDERTDILQFWEAARSCIHRWRTGGGRVRAARHPVLCCS